MSGCGCGQPMILSNAPAARMDVESVLMCDVLPDGTVAGQVLVEAVYDAASGQRVGQRLVHPDTGADYPLQGALQQCSDAQNCASPTIPVTTVGLCLADGTPIAVTVVRDCAGTVTSEGWINLTTGAWTAGTVPAGTVACGDSRSIQVSGTFCDVDAAGEVVGLVLVEYTYDDTGAISSVRLVDAVTGTTYTPTGTVTVCPAGVEQPEQDAVVLCDTAPDGTVTQFLRDYRRDETGVVVGHSDYRLDGTAYTPTGTVGLCRPAACETQQLCDVQEDVAAVLPSVGAPTESWQDLPNGVRWMRRGSDGATPGGWYVAGPSAPERFDFDRPVTIQYSVRFSGPTAAPLRIPAGWYLDSISTVQHTWNAATRTISPTASATQDGVSVFRIEAQTAQTMVAPVVVGTQPSGQTSQYGQITVTADQATPFLRTLCRGGDGTVTTTDTTLDGVTPYTVLGTAGLCPQPPPPPCRTVTTETLCDVSDGTPQTYTATNTAVVPPVSHGEPAISATTAGYMLPATTVDDLWDPAVGQVMIPTWSTDPGGYRVNAVSAAVSSTGPTPCGTPGNVRVRVTLRWTNTGPTSADFTNPETTLSLRNGNSIVARVDESGGAGIPNGASITRTVEAVVPWADVQAGRVTWYWSGVVYQGPNNRKTWRLDQYAVQITDAAPIPGCGENAIVPFVRHYVHGPDGALAHTYDTTLGGEAYAPQGTVQNCSPDDATPAPESCVRQVVERCGCDDTTGDGLGDVQYTELWAVDPCNGTPPVLLGTYRDGDLSQPYTPTAPVECTAAEAMPGPLNTGVRAVTGTAAQNIASTFPGLQSVSLTVLAGTVNTTMTDGTSVPIPVGVTMTWSVAKDEDNGLAAAAFAGATATTSYLLNWTYR